MTPKTILFFIIGLLVIASSFTLMGWFFSLNGALLSEEIFSKANPLGLITITAVLVIGGFYLFKIGFATMKNAV